jgi:hypothetical protein
MAMLWTYFKAEVIAFLLRMPMHYSDTAASANTSLQSFEKMISKGLVPSSLLDSIDYMDFGCYQSYSIQSCLISSSQYCLISDVHFGFCSALLDY